MRVNHPFFFLLFLLSHSFLLQKYDRLLLSVFFFPAGQGLHASEFTLFSPCFWTSKFFHGSVIHRWTIPKLFSSKKRFTPFSWVLKSNPTLDNPLTLQDMYHAWSWTKLSLTSLQVKPRCPWLQGWQFQVLRRVDRLG